MADMPACCNSAKNKYVDLGYSAMQATAKALRDHANGHQETKQLGK